MDTFYRTTKSTEPASGITSELLQRVPPFVYSIFNVRYKTGRDYRVPPFEFFSALCDFFSNFLLSPNGPPFKFFDILQQTEVSKSPKGPPSLVFGTVRLFQTSHFSFFRKFFQKNFRIFLLSPSIFSIFCNRLDFQKAERVPPFTSLKTKRFFEP